MKKKKNHDWNEDKMNNCDNRTKRNSKQLINNFEDDGY